MVRLYALSLGVGLCAMFLGTPPATATPTLIGSTGLIKVPTAMSVEDGQLRLGFTWIGGTRGYLLKPRPNRMYYATLQVLPSLEVGLNFLQVVGWKDPLAPGVANAIHRLSNLRYSAAVPGWELRYAIGLQDPLSANFLARGEAGKTNYGLSLVYGVLSQQLGSASFHVGYSLRLSPSPAAFPEEQLGTMEGLMFGVEWKIYPKLSLQAEYDTHQPNLGVNWQPFAGVGIRLARLFPDDWAYGAALTWQL